MNLNVFNKLPAAVQKLRVDTQVFLCAVGMTNREIKSIGEIVLPVVYGGHVLQQNFIVSGEISDACILGWDAIKAHGFILNGASKSISIGGVNSVQSLSPLSSLVLTKRVALPSWSTTACPVSVRGQIKAGLIMFSPHVQLPEGVQVDSIVMESNTENKYFIELRNLTGMVKPLPRGLELGTIEYDFEEISQTGDAVEIRNVSAQQSNKTLEPINADPKYVPKVKEILKEFADLVASSNTELGQTGLIKHKIDTQGKPPIRQRPYRASRNDAEEIDRQIKDMKEAGVIRESTSPWAAPVIIVAKKSGE